MAQLISTNFSLEELVFSQHRDIDNTPSKDVIDELTRLANETLEVARSIIGPIHISSGYRSIALNQLIGGSLSSQHTRGQAADCIPMASGLLKDFAKQLLSDSKLIYDQFILEGVGSNVAWIHISHAPVGRKPRMQKLMYGKFFENMYVPFDYDKLP